MELSAEEAEKIAAVMSGLSTPARVRILARLLEEQAPVGELAEELEMSQNLVSNHLRILRHLNLVVGERSGRTVVYRLQDEHVRTMVEQVMTHASHD